MGGINKRVSAEIGQDTCLLGFPGRDYIKSAAFQASSLRAGEGGVDEQQSVTINGSPTGGTWRLTFNGQQTAAITHPAATAAVEDALENLSNVGEGSVQVTGSSGGPYTVHFLNRLGHAGQNLLTAQSSLTGGTSPAIVVARATAGSDISGSYPAATAGWDPRIVVGSPSFPGTIVVKVTAADGGSMDKVAEYTGTGSIFGVIDGEEEFLSTTPAGDRDVAVYQYNCVFDASKIKNYATYKSAFDAWAAANSCKVVNG